METIYNIKHPESCSNLNDVFIYYRNKKKDILDNIIQGNFSIKSLDIDHNCMFNLGTLNDNKKVKLELNDNQGITNKFKCYNCELLTLVCNLSRSFPINIPFKNIYLYRDSILKQFDICISCNLHSHQDTIKYHSSFDELSLPICNNYCTSRSSRYIKLDPITNSVIISWFLEQLTDKIINNHYFFGCGGKYYLLKDYYNTIELDKFGTNKINNLNIESVLTQIFKLLDLVVPYDFSITEPEDVFTIDDQGIVRFNNLDKCGITLYQNPNILECKITNGVRIGSTNIIKNNNLIIERVVYTDVKSNQRILFRCHDMKTLKQCINSNSPFYRSSLNVYIMMLYLNKFENFRTFIKNDLRWNTIYKGLFLPLELKQKGGMIDSLEGMSLRCDAMEFLIGNL